MEGEEQEGIETKPAGPVVPMLAPGKRGGSRYRMGIRRKLVDGEEVVVKELWKDKLKDIEFFCKNTAKQAEELGIEQSTVWRWRDKMSLEEWNEIRDHYRGGYGRYAPIIDHALIKKAAKGDMKAVELFYQRMEGWSLKSGMDVTVTKSYGEMTQQELVKAIIGQLTPAEKELLEAKGAVGEDKT